MSLYQHNLFEPDLTLENMILIEDSINHNEITLENRNHTFKTKILPELTERQRNVLEALRSLDKPSSMHEVAEAMNVPLNTISGRFGPKELRGKGYIKVVGREDGKSLFTLTNEAEL